MSTGQIILIVLVAIAVILVFALWGRIVKMWTGGKVFFGEVRQEMDKVTWPSRDEVINSTILVGIVAIIVTIMVGISDSILGRILKAII